MIIHLYRGHGHREHDLRNHASAHIPYAGVSYEWVPSLAGTIIDNWTLTVVQSVVSGNMSEILIHPIPATHFCSVQVVMRELSIVVYTSQCFLKVWPYLARYLLQYVTSSNGIETDVQSRG